MNRAFAGTLTAFAVSLAFALTLAACTGSSGGDSKAVSAKAGPGKITVKWSHSSAESYTLEYTNGGGSGASAPNQIAISGTITDVTSPYEHDYLVYNEIYTYTVKAVDSAGNSSTVGSDSATPDRLPLTDIEFADENMEACVMTSTEAGRDNEGAEFAHQIQRLTPFSIVEGVDTVDYCASTAFQAEVANSLSGIEHLTGLTHLQAWYNEVTDVSPLAPLIQLTYLDLSENGIADLSPLASLVNLTTLDAGSNFSFCCDPSVISGVASLVTLTQAETIDVSSDDIYLPCADLQILVDALGVDVVSPAVTPGVTCFD